MPREPIMAERRSLYIQEQIDRIDRQMAEIHRTQFEPPVALWKSFFALAAGASACMVAGAVLAKVFE